MVDPQHTFIASIARGHHSALDLPRSVRHVYLFHLYPGALYAISVTLVAPLRPKKQAHTMLKLTGYSFVHA
jgi:hypothetical protein